MIPTSSLYPDALDTDNNLYLVHDALRVKLSEDYNPGDTSITVDGDALVLEKFPSTGLITLTEQCSDMELRALSFYYSSRTATTFDGLEILPGFIDSVKPKLRTNVTQNVMADHHNNLKNALIAAEEFIGIKGTIDTSPFGDTLEGRINFLRKLVFTPKAWFSADKRVGLVPLTINFTDQSYRLGKGEIIFTWDFGDTCSSTSTISLTETDTISITDSVPVVDAVKTYTCPGFFDVKLTVTNQFGTDEITFDKLINVRYEAPEEAIIAFIPTSTQIFTPGTLDGGNSNHYLVPPKIRSRINSFININIATGTNPLTGRSYGGEELNGFGSPIDPIQTYNWYLSDDLIHSVYLQDTKASYSIGGIYDMKLRVDTEFGSYRITTYEDCIDIIESKNLWLWNFSDSTNVKASEFGLISETFKSSGQTQTITRSSAFLDGTNNEVQAKAEFKRNVGFSPRGTISSGDHGTSMLFWAGGGSPVSSQEVKSIEYSGFDDLYISTFLTITHPWNWFFLSGNGNAYFVLGTDPAPVPFTNASDQVKTSLNLTTLVATDTPLTNASYSNGATELQEHPTPPGDYDGFGEPLHGRFAVYRTAWKDSTGYILRNDGVGNFFRIKSFYKTEGTLSNPFQTIRKLTDMAGPTKLEGQLVSLKSGVFFFNNSGNISAYNDTTGVWETGGPSTGTATFRSLQDTSIPTFDDPANTLLASSDEDTNAYLSFDYSNQTFIKFNALTLSFSQLVSRPTGEQWNMGIF